MTTEWAVVPLADRFTLDANNSGELKFTVSNPGEVADTVVFDVIPGEGAQRSWFTVPEPQRPVPGHDAVEFLVRLTVPAGTPPGRADIVGLAYSANTAPEESSRTSGRVAFEWKPKEKPRPIWPWLVAAAVLVLLVASVVTWLLTKGDGGPIAQPSPSATKSSAKPSPSPSPPDLPWPTPGDCLSHDPGNVTVTFNSSFNVWQVISGSQAMMAFKREEDALAGQKLAQAYRHQCFIGRGNTKPERYRYIMSYWRDPVRPSPGIANPDCLSHKPNTFTVNNLGDLGFRVESGSEAIALFATEQDANDAILVMNHHTAHCYIGRGYSGPDRQQYIVEWGTP